MNAPGFGPRRGAAASAGEGGGARAAARGFGMPRPKASSASWFRRMFSRRCAAGHGCAPRSTPVDVCHPQPFFASLSRVYWRIAISTTCRSLSADSLAIVKGTSIDRYRAAIVYRSPAARSPTPARPRSRRQRAFPRRPRPDSCGTGASASAWAEWQRRPAGRPRPLSGRCPRRRLAVAVQPVRSSHNFKITFVLVFRT